MTQSLTRNGPPDLLTVFDNSPLSARYWVLLVVLIVHSVVELFDFFIVSFLVAIVGPLWHLTYGRTSLILLSAGVGQILGAMMLSRASDQWGRKPILILSMILYALSAGAISLIPDGGWLSGGSWLRRGQLRADHPDCRNYAHSVPNLHLQRRRRARSFGRRACFRVGRLYALFLWLAGARCSRSCAGSDCDITDIRCSRIGPLAAFPRRR